MQHAQSTEIQNTLISALGVRYHVTGLLDLAHEITLVSLNAKITSAQIGDAGRVFSVMTNEITDISAALRETVEHIRALTQRWTRIIAVASQQMRRLRSLEEAQARGAAKHHDLHMLKQAGKNAASALKDYDRSYPPLLGELLRIVDDMEKSLKIVNYVKIGILIESERLGGTASNERSPFQHLANEMQAAAERIRDIAQQTMQQLKSLAFSKQ